MGINFHQLEIFLSVARERSFSQAAAKLRISQPSVSIQIKKLSSETKWKPVSGQGKVYVTLMMCRSYGPAWEQSVPHNVSMIELDEGVRMWSNVVGCLPEDVKIGDTVAIEYEDATEAISLPKFHRLS